ncbi:MAG TPA: DUF4203 domain-containing protein [Phycisphaerae bacterium]|nr:DUF4203 domain-containing protein [Phycisphaerae bacterium]
MSLHALIPLAQAALPDPNTPGQFTIPDIPSQGEVLDSLIGLAQSNYGAVMAMFLFACGLVYMLQGWKIFKVLVVANAAVLGAVIGAHLGGLLRGQDTWLYTGIAGGMLLAVLAGPLMKYAVSLMGGLAGSFVGYSLWHYVARTVDRPEMGQYGWVGALIGLITLGLLAFVILKAVVTIVTSIQGSLMTVSGIVALLMKHPALRESLEFPLRQNTHLIALLVGVPAVIGFAFQYSGVAKKAAKKKQSEGDG